MTIFIPSDHLVRIARSTLQVLATIASFAAIVAVLALAGYVLIWACGVLVLFIHALSGVLHAAYDAINGNPVIWLAILIFSFIISIKILFAFFPSLPSFFGVHGGRL